jgi:DNA-directed RNA polymerase omega subunit
MLYGRRLDEALEHVDGSRYALVHAVARRARQITLWLTADPAELRAEAASAPPASGELSTRDPVALAESEILRGDVVVRWDPDGRADEPAVEAIAEVPDPLLLDGLADESDEEEAEVTVEELAPIMSSVVADPEVEVEDAVDDPVAEGGEVEDDDLVDEPEGDDDLVEEMSLEEEQERELEADDDEEDDA